MYGATPFAGFAHRLTGEIPLQTMRFGTETVGWSKRDPDLVADRARTDPAGSFVVSVSVTLPAATSPGVGV